MEDKLKVNYHVDAEGNLVPFCTLLDCFDQICYFEFRKASTFNPWVYFCDDVNLAVDSQGNLSVMNTSVHGRYQNTEGWVIKQNHFEEISNLLRQKDTVMVSTAFNYIRNYDWWREGKGHLHTGHLSYLVEEDCDNYYIADNPDVFLGVEALRMDSNPSIVKIPKENFAEAFQKYCRIYKISFHDLPSEQDERAFLRDVIAEITEHYFAECTNRLLGRRAIQCLSEKCALREEEIFKSCYVFHIMVSRRLLLKRNTGILLDSGYGNEIIRCLNLSIEYWTKIKEMAYSYVINGSEVCESASSVLVPLMENEDILMGYLKKACIWADKR